jgi:hypothetical protein
MTTTDNSIQSPLLAGEIPSTRERGKKEQTKKLNHLLSIPLPIVISTRNLGESKSVLILDYRLSN